MTSFVKKKMKNWLAFNMLIQIFTIVKRVRHTALYWREFKDDHDTPKHQVYPQNTSTVSMNSFLDIRSLKQYLN